MNFRYYAKEDPWQDDDDGKDGRPVILARTGDGPDTEAIWTGAPGAWEPFPDLWERLIGGDWWDRISEERARRYFDAEAFAGGAIQEPLPEAEMEVLREAYRARKAREEQANAKP
jgi:hypothetical protein